MLLAHARCERLGLRSGAVPKAASRLPAAPASCADRRFTSCGGGCIERVQASGCSCMVSLGLRTSAAYLMCVL